MSSNFVRGGIALVAAMLLSTGAVFADEWQIVQSSGQIWVGSDGVQKASLEPSTTVPGGSTITTGPGGRALLVHGTQTMMIGANAVVTIPEGDSTGMTTILQRSGEVTFDVDRQKVQHFSVETPYLAAVVKGTGFSVTVGFDHAAVAVVHGLVEVTDLGTGEVVDTPPGQSATVSGPKGKIIMAGSGELAVPRLDVVRAPLVQRLTADELRAMQGASPANVDPAPGLIEVRGGPNDASVSLAAVGAGGGNGGGSGGSSAGGSGGTGELVVADQSGGMTGTRAGGGARFERDNGQQVATIAIIVLIVLSIFVPIGVAYLKGRIG